MIGQFWRSTASVGAVGLAAFHIPSPVPAQDLIYRSPARAGEVAVACFSRRYDRVHLASHPEQNVTQMVALAYRLPGAPRSESVFNMGVQFRAGSGEQRFSGVCRPASGGLSCGVECDGGAFSVTVRDGNSVLVDLGAGIATCDGDLAEGQGFGTDDNVFRLDRTAMSACRDLVWDDERRAEIFNAGGLQP